MRSAERVALLPASYNVFSAVDDTTEATIDDGCTSAQFQRAKLSRSKLARSLDVDERKSPLSHQLILIAKARIDDLKNVANACGI